MLSIRPLVTPLCAIFKSLVNDERYWNIGTDRWKREKRIRREWEKSEETKELGNDWKIEYFTIEIVDVDDLETMLGDEGSVVGRWERSVLFC